MDISFGKKIRFTPDQMAGDKYMPVFNSEEEYNNYFKEEVMLTNQYRNESGEIELNSISELEELINGLIKIGEHRNY